MVRWCCCGKALWCSVEKARQTEEKHVSLFSFGLPEPATHLRQDGGKRKASVADPTMRKYDQQFGDTASELRCQDAKHEMGVASARTMCPTEALGADRNLLEASSMCDTVLDTATMDWNHTRKDKEWNGLDKKSST